MFYSLFYTMHSPFNTQQLHFNHVYVYSEIFHVGTKFTKDPEFYSEFGEDESAFCFADPREAKTRDTLSPLFSRRAILRLENIVQEKVTSSAVIMLAAV